MWRVCVCVVNPSHVSVCVCVCHMCAKMCEKKNTFKLSACVYVIIIIPFCVFVITVCACLQYLCIFKCMHMSVSICKKAAPISMTKFEERNPWYHIYPECVSMCAVLTQCAIRRFIVCMCVWVSTHVCI